MTTATKEFTFDAAHRLSFHKGKCFNLHGHTYKVQVTFKRSSLINGMVKDFYEIKKEIQELVDRWDHATLLCMNNLFNRKLIGLLTNENMKVVGFPFEPTVENMAHYFLTELTEKGLQVYKIRMYETPTSYAEAINETISYS